MACKDLLLEMDQVSAYLRAVKKGETSNVPPAIKQKVDAAIAKHSK